jgi:lysophospholipase L1-like esterase
MIQFGHNDGGTVTTSTNGRPDLPGAGDETQTGADAKGDPEVVHTLGWYLKTYIADVRAKGAIPVVMAATPYNRWANGVFRHQPGDLSAVQKQIADDEKVLYLDHTEIIGEHFDQLGQDAVRPLFNADGLHTTTLGAIVNAESFIAGIKALEIKTLTDALNDKGHAIAVYKPAPAKPAPDSVPTPVPAPASASAAAK